MASASFNSLVAPALQPINEKLTRTNFPVCKALVTSALKGAQLSEFLYSKMVTPAETLLGNNKKTEVPNPELAIFIAKQQQVLNFLLNSLSKEMLEYVAAYTTPHEVWDSVISMAATQSRAHVINTRMALSTTRMALSTTRKGNIPIAQYVGKMRALIDDMASTGKKLDDKELVSYILSGLDNDFDLVVSAVAAHAKPVTVPELYRRLVGYE
jgi:hypothetical protein